MITARHVHLALFAMLCVVVVVPVAAPSASAAKRFARPGMPATVTVTDATTTGFTVRWTAPKFGGRVASYRLQRGGGTRVTVVASKRSLRFGGLACSTSYVVAVVAANATGPSAPFRVSARTTDCPPPQDDGTAGGGTPPADTTAPDTTITSSPAASTISTSASFAFTSTEAGATFSCALDTGAYAACVSPQAHASLGIGTHTFSVRARDAAGNVDPTPHAFTWTITMVAPPPPTFTCDRSATTATFSAQFAAATSGQTICLATGSYGSSWPGAAKAGMVTIRPADGAMASIGFEMNGARNITLDGVTIIGGALLNSTRDITIRNANFTGKLVIDGVANANILLDNNVHRDIDYDPTEAAGRISLNYGSATPSGVTVQNSLFQGGSSDGIQAGTGLVAIGNEFDDIDEHGDDLAHTDAIQLLGATGAVIRGNYIHHSADGIVAYDGVDSVTIEDNVIDLVIGRWGIELYSDTNSIVRHNTLVSRASCWAPCGHIILDHKPADPAGSGTRIYDNIASSISKVGGSTTAEQHHNMLITGATGADFAGTPTFSGGLSPTTFAGFHLAGGSPGVGSASDGLNVGIR